MELPPIPENEQERLNALRSSKLLDTDKEAVFDNLTSLENRFLMFLWLQYHWSMKPGNGLNQFKD